MDSSATEQQKNVLENEYPAWQVYRLLSQIKKKKTATKKKIYTFYARFCLN